jgi:molecular chaperone IbpA
MFSKPLPEPDRPTLKNDPTEAHGPIACWALPDTLHRGTLNWQFGCTYKAGAGGRNSDPARLPSGFGHDGEPHKPHVACKEDMAMRNFDFTPLFRNSVGFDRMVGLLDPVGSNQVPGYPPYNIDKTGDDAYRITMAVAGFAESDLDVQVEDNQLIISGRVDDSSQDDRQVQYLHRGIAERAFMRRFNLADHIEVSGASLVNGLLHVELKREVPESMKPRTIAIKGGDVRAIADKAA